MNFTVNDPKLFALAGVIIFAVLLQSIVFLIKAIKHAKEINMDMGKLKRVVRTAIIFTIAPAIAIVISVITLSKDLGLPLPWLRLSVIGSLSYETVAATNAESAMGLTFGSGIALTAQQYVTIAWVMTISIMVGIWLCPVLAKKLLGGVQKLELKDKKWADVFQNSLFLGMISAFIGYVFCDFAGVFKGNTAGLIPVLVFIVGALVTGLCALLMKKTGKRWIQDYALPLSLVIGMASAIPFTNWLG